MPDFYFSRNSINPQWLNLNQITFAIQEKERLIIKMTNNITIIMDNDDAVYLAKILSSNTVDFYEPEYDDKGYNHEDFPSREEVEASNKRTEYEEEWGRDLGSFSDNDYLDDDEIPI
jgi:hypothetical protein